MLMISRWKVHQKGKYWVTRIYQGRGAKNRLSRDFVRWNRSWKNAWTMRIVGVVNVKGEMMGYAGVIRSNPAK
jgi:hypothetical protein